ncbi:hypothetical protein C818_02446 [Lachnospiraceae bacterium MD308]|nr:hypothetical protein C818_02446 [Lachnospiraceae bacterium MD308]
MIHTMTDETYAVNLTLEEKGKEKEDMMILIAFFPDVTGWPEL